MYYAVCEHVCASVRLCVAKLYYVRHKFASSAICANDIDIIDIHWIWWPFAPDADYLFHVPVPFMRPPTRLETQSPPLYKVFYGYSNAASRRDPITVKWFAIQDRWKWAKKGGGGRDGAAAQKGPTVWATHYALPLYGAQICATKIVLKFFMSAYEMKEIAHICKMWPNKRKLKKVSRLADKLKYLA